MSEDFDFTLADLMDLDISDVQEIRFETLPAGIYGFKVQKAEMTEGTNKDDEKRFIAIFEFEVVEVKALVKKVPDGGESLIGKKHTEKLYIVPTPQEKALEGIGRIRAFLTDMGCESAGALGSVVAATEGHIFTSKITNESAKDDKSKTYARMKLDPKKK